MSNQQLTVLKKIQELSDSYNKQFSAIGMKCSVSLKKFTTYGYDGFKRNIRISSKPEKHAHYKVIVIRFSPLSKNNLPISKQREYAFKIYYKKNRTEKHCSDEAVICLIEKLFNKILKKAKSSTPLKVCRNGVSDFFRYILNDKYRYMDKCFKIKREYIDLALTTLFASALFIILILLFK